MRQFDDLKDTKVVSNASRTGVKSCKVSQG